MKIFSRRSITLFMVMMLAVMTAGSVSAVESANDDFERTWARTDKPVSDLTVSRTWMWGPEANTGAMMETYAESPGGQREVQYYDKARMEINHPEAEHNLWYVTNGLLVVEMITGQMQMGDNTFNPINPAGIPVAGDADDTEGPTYAALAQLLDDEPLDEGAEITWRVDKSGNVSNENPLTGHGVTAAYWDEETNHTVASVFWDFMNSSGIVWEDGSYVTDQLFENPFYATGRPVTEAYWATVKVAGEVQSVLLQCFERRCLTYTPQNEDGWKVEAGNVGQHYYAWRYGQTPSETLTVFLVAEGDDGASGMPIGCDDSLIAVQRPATEGAEPVEDALTSLFSIKTRDYGESGLTTALYSSDLTVDSVEIVEGNATVNISGEISLAGSCDNPRFIEQIRQTVLAVEGVDSADIFVNGTALDDLFGPTETQTATVFFVETDDEGNPVGCGDLTLAGVEVSFSAEADPIFGALTALFAFDERNVGDDQLYNALHQSDLTGVSVSLDAGHATVDITGDYAIGGVCDAPRFVEQITETVLNFESVNTAEIFINDIPLEDLFSQM